MPSHHHCSPLKPGATIDAYRIERALSRGGFSIVYLARDAAGDPVAIKEYMPAGMVTRSGDSPVPVVAPERQAAFVRGMRSFLEEARLLAFIRHPNVVEVLTFAKANDTAYMVMRYEHGHTLHQYVGRMRERGKGVGETVLRDIFVRLLSGLHEVHSHKLLHLDIKPANIYLRDDSHPVLLDFGATRSSIGRSAPGLGQTYTAGFAAPEQQGSGEGFGPWTDIYAIGATLYACLALGETPPPAAARLQEDTLRPAERRWAGHYSPQLLEVIDWCLKLPVMARPQCVDDLQKVLSGQLLDLVDPSWFAPPRA